MMHSPFALVGIALMLATLSLAAGCRPAASRAISGEDRIALPTPRVTSSTSLEQTLQERRSIRQYRDRLLTWEEIGQLLWAAQGVTSPAGLRTAPSAGALYPLEVYVATPAGVYHYDPASHTVSRILQGDRRRALGDAALQQGAVYDAPAVFIIAAVYQRTAIKYGDRAERYVHMEVGHAAQNLLLQAVALKLGAVPIGAFYDDQIQRAAGLPADHRPLYLIPVGAPAQR